MKKFSIIILMLALSSLSCFADRFIITDMNGRKTITIGTRTCHINSEFTSEEVTQIKWNSSNVTLIEAQNIKTKTICYFVPNREQDKKQSPNVFQRLLNWITDTKKLYTREIEEYNLENTLTEREFYLADCITIPIDDDKNEIKHYYAAFYRNGHKHILPLTVENGNLVFNRNQFLFDGIALPYKYVLTIYCTEGDTYKEITNGMLLKIVE